MKLSELEIIKTEMVKAGIAEANPGRRLVEAYIRQITAKVNARVNAFSHYCGHFGLKPEHLGAKFYFRGRQYQISGLNPGAPKFAINGKRLPDGKEFKFPADLVLKCLPKMAEAA